MPYASNQPKLVHILDANGDPAAVSVVQVPDSGCQIEEMIYQEQLVPFSQGSHENLHGNNHQDESLKASDEGFRQMLSNSDFRSSNLLGVHNVVAQMPVLTTLGPFFLQSCNGAYLIRNSSSQTTGFVSSSKQEFGLTQPLGKVFKTQKSVTYNFFLNSGKTCYVKSYPNCIKFYSKVLGTSYLIDQKGVRSSYEEFQELAPGFVENMWKTNYESEVGRHQRAIQKKLVDPSPVAIADITVSEGESVVINQEDMRLFSDTRELSNMTVSLTDNFFVRSVLNKGSEDCILVRCSRYRFRQCVFFDGKSLVLMFDTQSASLGKYGEFSLST